MPLDISDTVLAAAAQKGLEDAVRDVLRNSWSHRDKIPQALTKAMHDLESNGWLHNTLRRHLEATLDSPEMRQTVREAVLKQISDKLGGAFQGVLLATAKKIGNTPEMQEAVRQLATNALQKGQA